jgi:cytochrome c551
MSTLVFVLAFVLLGLGTFLIALSGGRRGLGATLQSQSRGSRRFALGALLISIAVLGIGVPAAVIAAVNDNDSIPSANVTSLTKAEKHGRELFGDRCAACHTLAASDAVAQVGPNLDELKPNAKFVETTIKNGKSDGNGQMPAGIFVGQDAKDVAAYVAKATGAG